MRGGTNTRGYTIVEVMIFLAISGIMFIMAAAFISGKQAKNEFMQGMNDINTQVQQVINDVSNGFYPSPGDFACQAGASGGSPTFTGTSTEQGGKQGCVFIGKVIQFGVKTDPDTDNVTYKVYTVVGRQFQATALATDIHSLIPPANLGDAQPVAADPGDGGPDLTQKNSLEWGVRVYAMYETSSAGVITPTSAVGFFSGFATAASGTLDSGGAAPITAAIPDSAPLGQYPDVDAKIGSLTTLPPANLNPTITICFNGAGVNEFGMLTIGSSDANVQSQRLSTHMQISVGAPEGICAPAP